MLDTIHVKPEHHVFHILGHEIVFDVPVHTFLLALVGAAFLLRYTVSYVRLLAELLVVPGTPLKTFQKKGTKTYAIVTGCTAGIGLEFARQLAKKGFGIVLVGRRKQALEEVAKELESKYAAPSRIVIADATNTSALPTALADIQTVLGEVDVGVLVNNVGASHEMPVAFAETEADEMDKIIATNISWTLHLTRTVLPHLIARSDPKANKKAKTKPTRSLVLNIGSLSGHIPSALLATYSCTKGGLQTWTTALGTEVEPQGVMVRMVFPAFVVSAMSKIRRPSLTVPLPRDFVASTLSSLGLNRGAQFRPFMSTPYPAHAVMDYVIGVTGSLGMWAAVRVILGMHKDIRKRALRKKEREAKGK